MTKNNKEIKLQKINLHELLSDTLELTPEEEEKYRLLSHKKEEVFSLSKKYLPHIKINNYSQSFLKLMCKKWPDGSYFLEGAYSEIIEYGEIKEGSFKIISSFNIFDFPLGLPQDLKSIYEANFLKDNIEIKPEIKKSKFKL